MPREPIFSAAPLRSAPPFTQIRVNVVPTIDEAAEPNRSQDVHCHAQPMRPLVKQPSQNKQTCIIVSHPTSERVKIKVIRYAHQEPTPLVRPSTNPNHAQEYIDSCHGHRPMQRYEG